MKFFEDLRRAYYPPEQNRVPAHVMLFHNLSGVGEHEVVSDIQQVLENQEPFDVAVGTPRSIGRGVSYRLRSTALDGLHTNLSQRWEARLIAQDREPYRSHVVVQNKVTTAVARETLETLTAKFRPFDARAIALRLWLYRNGSWHEPRTFPFATTT